MGMPFYYLHPRVDACVPAPLVSLYGVIRKHSLLHSLYIEVTSLFMRRRSEIRSSTITSGTFVCLHC